MDKTKQVNPAFDIKYGKKTKKTDLDLIRQHKKECDRIRKEEREKIKEKIEKKEKWYRDYFDGYEKDNDIILQAQAILNVLEELKKEVEDGK